jgi:hypothetical protein
MASNTDLFLSQDSTIAKIVPNPIPLRTVVCVIFSVVVCRLKQSKARHRVKSIASFNFVMRYEFRNGAYILGENLV